MESIKLQELYRTIDKCDFCMASGNKLQHIHGFGTINPKFMLIAINPTYRNLSSHPDYKGPRFPFIGVRQFWRVLGEGGLIRKSVANKLPARSNWRDLDTRNVQNEILNSNIFLTNVVKCCYNHSKYPPKEVIDKHVEFLAQEIKILKPQIIITFGALTFDLLTKKSLHLSKYWQSEGIQKYYDVLSGLSIPVIPCYFPIGRGKPQEAVRVLQKLSRNYTHEIKNTSMSRG